MKLNAAFAVALFAALALTPQMVSDTTYLTSLVGKILFENNLHEVVPGRFYRAAEMSREDLAITMKRFGIKSVVDLRLKTDRPDESGWSEKEVVERNGGRYFQVPVKSSRLEQKERLEDILSIYDIAETPILVHCTSGTHRSGIAAAMWLMDKEHQDIESAKDQLSVKYGFFRFERVLKSLVQGHPTLDTILALYADETADTPTPFRKWLKGATKLSQQKGETQTVSSLEPTRFYLISR